MNPKGFFPRCIRAIPRLHGHEGEIFFQLFNYTNGSNVFIKLLIFRKNKYNHCEIFFLLVLALILYHTTLNPWNDIQLGILRL